MLSTTQAETVPICHELCGSDIQKRMDRSYFVTDNILLHWNAKRTWIIVPQQKVIPQRGKCFWTIISNGKCHWPWDTWIFLNWPHCLRRSGFVSPNNDICASWMERKGILQFYDQIRSKGSLAASDRRPLRRDVTWELPRKTDCALRHSVTPIRNKRFTKTVLNPFADKQM